MKDDLISREAVMECFKKYHYRMATSVLEFQDELKSIPSAEPLTEEDYIELRGRFGEYVELFVRDMITGKLERWNGIATGISVFSPLKYHLSSEEPMPGKADYDLTSTEYYDIGREQALKIHNFMDFYNAGRRDAEPEIIHCGECAFAEVADPEDVQDGYLCQFYPGSVWFSGSFCSWAKAKMEVEK